MAKRTRRKMKRYDDPVYDEPCSNCGFGDHRHCDVYLPTCIKCGHKACAGCNAKWCDVIINDNGDLCCDGECTYPPPEEKPVFYDISSSFPESMSLDCIDSPEFTKTLEKHLEEARERGDERLRTNILDRVLDLVNVVANPRDVAILAAAGDDAASMLLRRSIMRPPERAVLLSPRFRCLLCKRELNRDDEGLTGYCRECS